MYLKISTANKTSQLVETAHSLSLVPLGNKFVKIVREFVIEDIVQKVLGSTQYCVDLAL